MTPVGWSRRSCHSTLRRWGFLVATVAAFVATLTFFATRMALQDGRSNHGPVAIKALNRGADYFFAAGADSLGRAGVWISRDGTDWDVRAIDLGGQEIGAVLDLDLRLGEVMGVGYIETTRGDIASSWFAGLGRRVDIGSSAPHSRARALASRPDRIVAVGTTRTKTFAPIAWLSLEGSTWSEFPLPLLPELRDINVLALDVVDVGAQGFVALGVSQRADRVCPLAWLSPDGETWRMAPEIVDCVEGTVAGGMSVGESAAKPIVIAEIGGQARAWRLSSDRWIEEKLSPGRGGSETIFGSCSLLDGKVVVVGSTADGAAIWLRRVNGTWNRVQGPPNVTYTVVLASGSDIYVGSAQPGRIVRVLKPQEFGGGEETMDR